MLVAPLPLSLLSNNVQNARLRSNTEALRYRDRKVQILRTNLEVVGSFASILAGNMNRKMLRLLFMAEATFVQSTECIYSAHYTAVGFGLHFREKGFSSGYLNTMKEGLSKFLLSLPAFLILSFLRI